MVAARLLVVCVVLEAVYLCDGLKKGDTGVCGVPDTITKKVIKSVRQQYRCGNRKWCYRTIKTPVTHKEKIISYLCCEGWEYVESEDACRPLCRLGCKNGTCIAPDQCQCPPPLVLKNYSCEQPVCEPPCFNGRCVNDSTCSCYDNLIAHNATHCAPVCNTGYAVEEQSLQCIAKCASPCVNSTCVAPDICECYEGHAKAEPNVCVPHCEPSCVNSKCTAPNVCSCDEGYAPDQQWSCKPKCEECDSGMCTAPNQCQCNDGYSKQDGKCAPVCDEPCSNGVCSEPNACTCDKGYASDKEDKFKCNPVCDPVCVNASCVSPDKCACDPGYETRDERSCKPKCKSCNGECVAPDVCRCLDGYSLVNGTCAPACADACVNGFCSAPEVCSCNEGFLRNESNPVACFRDCKGPCGVGVCSDVGICLCSIGFELVNDTCISMTPVRCGSCNVSCGGGACRCAGGRPCYDLAGSEEVTSSPRLAGLELTFLVGGLVGLLLLVLLILVIERTWRRRKNITDKAKDTNDPLYSSVTYIVPDTLVKGRVFSGPQRIPEEDYAHEGDEPTASLRQHSHGSHECEDVA